MINNGSIRLIRLSVKHGDFFVVGVGHLVEHGIEFAGLLAHVDHVDDHVVEDAFVHARQVQQHADRPGDEEEPEEQGDEVEARLGVFLHRLGDRFALADRLVDLLEEVLEDGVARGLLGDVQGFEDGHAAGHQRAEGAHGAGDDVLFDQLAEDRAFSG